MTTSTKATKRTPVAMNGVDTPALLATIGAVAAQPALAKFQFRAEGRWISGTRSETTMHGFSGAGGEHTHVAAYTACGDHPAVLCGGDAGPTPVEWLLHALASCLIGGIGNIAAVRGIKLRKAEVMIAGDIDLRGILGLEGCAQRLRGHSRDHRHRRRCSGGTTRADRAAGEGALRGPRRTDQRRCRRRRRQDTGDGGLNRRLPRALKGRRSCAIPMSSLSAVASPAS